MSKPSTVRAAVMTAAGSHLELREFVVPAVGESELLVQITCATICPSDLHTWRGRRPGPTPAILGHEAVGVIEQIGAGRRLDGAGNPIAVGDRVTWTLHSSCGECDYCTRDNLPMKCRKLRKFGHQSCEEPPHLFGAMAEKCLLDQGVGVLRVPDSLGDLAAAPANCAAATAIAACEAVNVRRAKSILLHGCGALGVYASAYASTLGAEVVALDRSPDRLDAIASFGATATICTEGLSAEDAVAQTRGAAGADGFCAAIGFSASHHAIELAVETLRIGGAYAEVGVVSGQPTARLDLKKVVTKSLSIRGVHNYRFEHLRAAVAFLDQTDDRLDWRRVVGDAYPLTEANQALAAAESGQHLRVALLP